MKKYLVTGGAGFIGSNIVAKLLELGNEVRVLDNFATGKRENLLPFENKIKLIEGSLTDLETVRLAIKGVDYVLHQGALPSVPRSIEQPINSNDVNISGTLNVLVASKDESVKRVVIASSSSVYGNSKILPKKEEHQTMPLSPYAVSKLTGENYAKVFSNLFNLETICLRYFNVFGPNQNPYSQYSAVIPKFIKAIIKDESPIIFGDGLQSRDFSYVDNIVEANIMATEIEKTNGEVINIACNDSHNLIELVDAINSILLKNIKPTFQNERTGDVKHSYADISLAKNILNYEPKVNFIDGLKKTINWIQKNNF
ncbi:MAG: SDR family oxidoreductase [Bacteroidota bacterium]